MSLNKTQKKPEITLQHPKRYQIDFDKVNRVKDVIAILQAMKITFPETGYEEIEHLLKEIPE